MNKLLRRFQYLLQRGRQDQELADEMEFHREMAARGGGVSFGSPLRLREESRDAWGWTWIDSLAQDVRYAFRMLRKSPGFTLAAVMMLAIGIGANVAVFGFFDLLVLRPLNVKDPETLLRFHRRSPREYASSLPYPEAAFFRDHTKTLSAVLLVNQTRVAIEGEPKQAEVQFVSPNYFAELGATPLLGRMLDPEQDRISDAVVLSHGFWQRHFGGNAAVLGQSLHVNGKPASIVGVARADFGGLSMEEPAMWAALERQPYFAAGSRLLTSYSPEGGDVLMWGRLSPGYAPQAAEAELLGLAAALRKEQPVGIWENEALPSEPGALGRSLRRGGARGTGTEDKDPLYPLFGILAGLTLLILTVTCANLGSLLLARGIARQQEVAVRLSVGAAPRRVMRQLLTESIVLALISSMAGTATGFWMLRTLMLVSGAPPWMDATPNWRVLLFAVASAFVTAGLFGLAPAWQIARQRHRSTAVRHVLVAAQVAASCLLLIVTALLSRAANHAASANPGFDYQQLVTIDPGLGKHGWKPEQARAYLDTLKSRLIGIPGVEAVSLTRTPPLGRVSITAGVEEGGRHVGTQLNNVDENFFRAMGIPLLRGRNLARGATHEVVISESMARGLWPGEDALGKRLPFRDQMAEVVGISANARAVKLEDSGSMEMYLPLDPGDLPSMYVLVRTSGAPEAVLSTIAATARAIDRDVLPEVELVKRGFERKVKDARYTALAVGSLGLISQFVACLGIFGVVAYAVSQKTKEIGIRIALGADRFRLINGILSQFAMPVGIGMALGFAGAAAASRVLQRIMFGVSHMDPAAYVGAAVIFALTALAAALVPARRVLRIDPWKALRYE